MESVKEKILDGIKYYKERIELESLIIPNLEKFDGKKISKRMSNEIAKTLKANNIKKYFVSYNKDLKLIKIWQAGTNNSFTIISLITDYMSADIFYYNAFKEKLDINRNIKELEKLTQALNFVDKWEQEYKDIKNSVRKLKDEANKYHCGYFFDFDFTYYK